MDDEWKPISRDREMSVGKHGVKIVRPIEIQESYPVDCSVCGFMIFGLENIYMLDKYGCCQECAFEWAQPMRKDWEEGWRPTKKQVNEYINKRLGGIN